YEISLRRFERLEMSRRTLDLESNTALLHHPVLGRVGVQVTWHLGPRRGGNHLGPVVLVVDHELGPIWLALVLRFQIREAHQRLHRRVIRRRIGGLGGVEDLAARSALRKDNGAGKKQRNACDMDAWSKMDDHDSITLKSLMSGRFGRSF